MSIWSGFDASASGLTAERLRLDLIASNLANVDVPKRPGSPAYREEQPVFSLAPGGGVEVVGIVANTAPPRVVHDPGNPLANANGDVVLSNVNVVAQMVDMLGATRAYEANASALDALKQNVLQALNIGGA